MTRAGRVARLTAALAGAAALASACATFGGVEVLEAQTGERIVRVRSAMPFDRLAEEVWGDASRGEELARLARLPYERPVPRGTVLVVPGAGPANLRDSDRLYEEGMAAAAAKDYDAAVDAFRACLKRTPERLDAKLNLGLALAETGKLGDATGILEDVVRARPRHAESRYALGSVLHKRKAYGRALSEFEAAFEADPGLAKAAFAAARTLEDLGDVAAARAAWQRFLDRFPKDRLSGEASRRLSALTAGTGGGKKKGR